MDPSFRWDDEQELDPSFRWDDEQELDPGAAEGRPVLSLSKGPDDEHELDPSFRLQRGTEVTHDTGRADRATNAAP